MFRFLYSIKGDQYRGGRPTGQIPKRLFIGRHRYFVSQDYEPECVTPKLL